MSRDKKKFTLNTVSLKLDCMNSCKKQNLSKIFNPQPKSKQNQKQNTTPTNNNINQSLYNYFYSYTSPSISSSPQKTITTTTSSPTLSPNMVIMTQQQEKAVRGFGRVGGQSVAVEKESEDPYFDFRQSMLQMILEKQIYSEHEMKELLHCFLQLNSPIHHGVIVRAFTEIWNALFSLPRYNNYYCNNNNNNNYFSQPSASASGGGGGSDFEKLQQYQHCFYYNNYYYDFDGCNNSRDLFFF